MEKKKNIGVLNKIFPLMIVMSTLFMGIGYAALNSITLDISGNATAQNQNGVYITDIEYKNSTNADMENTKIISTYKTMINSDVVLSDVDASSSITYTVTVYNATDDSYMFDGVKYEEDFYSNVDIVCETVGLEQGDILKKRSYMTFDIVFKYDDSTVPENNVLNSYINLSFIKVYSIAYVNIANNNLPKYAAANETLVLNFQNNIPLDVDVYVNDSLTTDYTYSDNTVSVSNVTGDIKMVGFVEEPNLSNNDLVPVVYDGTNWKVADTTTQWYNYSEQNWANAVVLKSGVTLDVGDPVDISNDVKGMFVWIPRYEYKLSSDGSNEVFINFISDDITVSTDGYYIPPAFTFGSSDLKGIWVGKFETSVSTTSTCYSTTTYANCNTTDLDIYVLPNVKSLREQTISTQFTLATNFKEIFENSSLDSHMLKNSEWSAVAYLSQSQYGKYGNPNYSGENKEIYVNNSSSLYTGMSSGSPNYVGDWEMSYEYHYGFNNDKFISEQNGVGASTTGNITGIYDMNGGTYEYVMGYLTSASSTFGSTSGYNAAGFTSAPDSKYYDSYTSTNTSTACNGSYCYGHGFDTSGWNNDDTTFVTTDSPWLMRGGVLDSGASGGIFAYSITTGYSGAYATFRIAIVEET